MKWILIYMLFSSGNQGTSLSTNSQEFRSKKACLKAKQKILYEFNMMHYNMYYKSDIFTVKAFCVKK